MTERPAQRLERLRSELNEAQEIIDACKHQYSSPVPATRKVFDAEYAGIGGRGSDPIFLFDEVERTEHGWKRECELCGHSQYTSNSKPIIKDHEPDFGGVR